MHDQSQPDPVDPADVAIARDEARLRRRQRIRTAVVLMGMLVGYVLSPALLRKLSNEGMLPSWFDPVFVPVFDVFLWPLIFAHENVPVIARFYAAYFHLIGVD